MDKVDVIVQEAAGKMEVQSKGSIFFQEPTIF